MVLTFFSFLALTISGMGFFRVMARYADLRLNTPIELGTGFFLAAAAAGYALEHSRLPVSFTSYIILTLSCIVATAV
ncbi:MAG: hypothetical protein EBT93_14700, partial [Alphaproteobacteria bacterium]|nr:hypothetical protein [Alphaproteobacteria bacterium]